MKQPENQSKTYSALFNDIDEGRIKIPQFQRDFVWSKAQAATLIDSILKGFPIGTFILWKTKDRLQHMRNIGNINLKEPPSGDMVHYVLDGQQRITSLYAVQKGAIITREGRDLNYNDIAIDLAIDPTDEHEIVFEQAIEGQPFISIFRLLNASVAELLKDHGDRFLNRIAEYKSRLEQYSFSTVVIDEYPIEVACEVFTRINTTGKELTLFEIMVAKTLDQQQSFDLAERYNELVSGDSDDKNLDSANYGELPAETILQCVAANLSDSIDRRDVLKIDRSQFIESWGTTIDGLFAAIDYLHSHLEIVVSRILPYNALLIPLSWFFIRQDGRAISSNQNALLKQYFYWASLSNRFQSTVGTKVATDLDKMRNILEGKQPRYDEQELQITPEALKWRPFSVGDAFCKAIVCLLAAKEPKSLKSNGKIILDNSNLRATNGRNYHHFFPRSFLKKQGYEASESNSLMNIILVDDYLNKRIIGSRAPSDYVRGFMDENRELQKTLETHYIGSPKEMGIWDDDYKRFVYKRAKIIADALTDVLNPDLE